jgi:methionyl-tRNA synthetase
VLYVTLEVLRIVSILAQPVMPTATAALLGYLGQPEGAAREFSAIATPITAGTELPAPHRCSRSTRNPQTPRTLRVDDRMMRRLDQNVDGLANLKI